MKYMKKLIIFPFVLILFYLQNMFFNFLSLENYLISKDKKYEVLRLSPDGILSYYFIMYYYTSLWMMDLQFWADEYYFEVSVISIYDDIL